MEQQETNFGATFTFNISILIVGYTRWTDFFSYCYRLLLPLLEKFFGSAIIIGECLAQNCIHRLLDDQISSKDIEVQTLNSDSMFLESHHFLQYRSFGLTLVAYTQRLFYYFRIQLSLSFVLLEMNHFTMVKFNCPRHTL